MMRPDWRACYQLSLFPVDIRNCKVLLFLDKKQHQTWLANPGQNHWCVAGKFPFAIPVLFLVWIIQLDYCEADCSGCFFPAIQAQYCTMQVFPFCIHTRGYSSMTTRGIIAESKQDS